MILGRNSGSKEDVYALVATTTWGVVIEPRSVCTTHMEGSVSERVRDDAGVYVCKFIPDLRPRWITKCQSSRIGRLDSDIMTYDRWRAYMATNDRLDS